MTQRKAVFESKVIQKLFPATPTEESKKDPPHIVEPTQVKRQTCRKVSLGKLKSGANPGQRVYTVLPPPPDYDPSSASTTLFDRIQSIQDPAEENILESDEESGEETVVKVRRKRRKRKQKSNPKNLEKDGTEVCKSITLSSQASSNDGDEHLSKNKRRKLKKKRHKDKMFSMGLIPRATAVEFIYQKDGAKDEEEEKEDKKRAAELSDFLRSTLEIYMSDSSEPVGRVPQLPITMNNLLEDIEDGRKPNSVLKHMCSLKTFAQQNKIDSLDKALDELSDHPSMSTEETAAVISLFKYWITEVFPVQEDKKMQQSI